MPLAQIKFSDYGARPDGSANAKDAFKAAFDACRAKGNCELIIDPGVYLISDPEAIKLRDAVMSLKDKSQDENSIFQFYFPYVTGLDMRNLKNVKVTAKGVTILCEGFMEPVTLEGSKNVCIEGLNISYKRKYCLIGINPNLIALWGHERPCTVPIIFNHAKHI